MRVLFVSCYPDIDFDTMIKKQINISQAAQKFNKLLVKGLCGNDCNVDVVVCTDLFSSAQTDNEEFYNRKVNYYYIKKKDAYKFSQDWCSKNKDGIVFADSLAQWADEILKAAKMSGNQVLIHITDLPMYLYPSNSFRERLRKFKATHSFRRKISYASRYIILTKQMQKRLHLPIEHCLVMEGLVDSEKCSNTFNNNSSEKRKFVYTGILSKQYGLDNLVEAFCSEKLNQCILSLYGGGDYVEHIVEISKKHPNIRYEGYVTNSVAIEAQQNSFCLINPRPVGGEYTKYSFPSKNIEYMLSGRPVITTKLPGIPKEYSQYYLFFENDSVDGIINTISSIIGMDKSLLDEKGKKAYEFVCDKKNNIAQVRRILQFIMRNNK